MPKSAEKQTPPSQPRSTSRRAFLRALAGQQPTRTLPALPVTPVEQFFHFRYRPTAPLPAVNRSSWSLWIGGLVGQPLLLTLDDLLARPAVEEMRTIACIGNPIGGSLIGNAVWRGVLLDPLLEQAGIHEGATRVRFDAADGYRTSMPLERVLGQRALLAYEMNGAPLSPEQGFPLRALIPGLYGQKSPKWLTNIVVIDHDFLGYWESSPRNWSDDAAVKTHAIMTAPKSHDAVRVGQAVTFQGVAFAGTRRITSVEVSIDGGGWMPADLIEPPSPLAWTGWQVVWTPEVPGEYEICVRAADETGFVQSRRTAPFSDAYPAGTDAIHPIILRVF